MITAEQYAEQLRNLLGNAIASGLTMRQLNDPLIEGLASVLAAGSLTKEQLTAATEIVRNDLDTRIIHYDNLSSHPHFDRRSDASGGDRGAEG